MTFPCTLMTESGGRWRAVHESRDDAIEKLKGEIRYRLELCPCTGESYRQITVELRTIG